MSENDSEVFCYGRSSEVAEGVRYGVGGQSTAVGSDGSPICDEFACRTWGCWCVRSDEPECEHGNHPATCGQCPDSVPFGSAS